MRSPSAAVLAALTLAAAGAGTTPAVAAGAPPPPKTFGGAKLSRFASGMKNPTSFAFGNGETFAGDSGNSHGVPNGGVYVLRRGRATKLPDSPLFVAGMQFHAGTLYMSAATPGSTGLQFEILAWKGWNGTTFTTRTAIFTAPGTFQGFNGIAFGRDGRLYVGVNAGLLDSNDHGPATLSPHLYQILSMTTRGTALRVFASGIRQPWQMAFAPSSSAPFVSDLGQDSPPSVKNPPDFLLKVKPGDNYGFPGCNHTQARRCNGFAKPFASFASHTDIMGLAVVGRTLYLGSYLGAGADSGGALYSMPVSGGPLRPVVTGFPLATDALAAHGGYLYVGGSTRQGAGSVYRVKP